MIEIISPHIIVGLFKLKQKGGIIMFRMQADPSFIEKNVRFGVLEVIFPQREAWDIPTFEARKERELAGLKDAFADYDRKAVFGVNPYNRYFKKYKKTYPVLQQLESFLLKDRPFPSGNPVNEIAFLTELQTQMLIGTHDIDRMIGTVELFCPTEKLPYPGMRGEEIHTYPGDVSGRDEGGIILSMIAGADERTYIRADSTHIAYLFFGAPGVTGEQIQELQDVLAGYVRTLAPTAETQKILL